MITNAQSGTRVDEIAESIYRISTAVTVLPGGFTFNQYLVDDEQPLLYHTGPRRLFELTGEAVAAVMPIERLRWIGLSHFEADECGALNAFLAAAPRATPLCSRLAAMVSVDDYADRPARGLTDGEELALGARSVLVPVEYDDAGNVLDGHHRIRCCEDLGIAQWPKIVRRFDNEADKRTHAR